MTDLELKEIEERCKSATKGPWKSFIEGRELTSGDSFIMTGISEYNEIYLSGGTSSDQDFIACARQDVPKLIKEIRELKLKIAILKK